ncbi:uncharacterized protein LOC116035804 [Sander lucioperca]|uniref:uncharacterized protein LOC116035804 n=1 Tax=Sander lucioperca TaxID=283035 RepID=UPI0016539AE9|nr:uncharacterized protein LOC116035804 [Sander lucioperca]
MDVAKNNLPAEQQKMVATFMCNNTATADCFYALSLNVGQSKRMREHFRQALTHTMPSPESPGASSSSTTTRKRSCKPKYSFSSKDKTPVPYQESGTSGLEEQREFMARLQNTPEKALRTSQYGRLMVALTPLEARPSCQRRFQRGREGQRITWYKRLAARNSGFPGVLAAMAVTSPNGGHQGNFVTRQSGHWGTQNSQRLFIYWVLRRYSSTPVLTDLHNGSVAAPSSPYSEFIVRQGISKLTMRHPARHGAVKRITSLI